MAKKTAKPIKPVRKPREPMSAEAKLRARRIAAHVLCGIAFGAACTGAFIASERYVDRIARPDAPPAVVIKDRPVWMSDALAQQIVATVQPTTPLPAEDHQALVERANTLASNPWVKRVNAVRRVYDHAPGDVIQIDCDFRAPVALVRWQDAYWYVDSDGVRLPERLSAEQAQQLISPSNPHRFFIIDGVARAPAAPGTAWPGGEVQAGIELIALLAREPFANQIVKIDVSNYAGRRDPHNSQLNLVTRDGRELRWGQPPSSSAFFVEAKVDKKLEHMRQAYSSTGRVDMGQPWIDLRFDTVTVPDARGSASR